jgi:hypothetical protein
VNLVPTDLNRNLVDAALNRLASEQFYIGGKSGFWRFVGVGLLGLGLGSAIGIGFYGYAYVKRNSDNLTSLSATFSKALSNARLHATAEGKVSIEPHEISLAKGQILGLDPNSFVRLDPAAKVLADGELTVQAPSISRPPSRQVSSTSAPAASTIANFTIFKSVNFEKGSIMTGWRFLTSAQKVPTSQYCYYTESAENPGLNVVVYIGNDMKLEPPKTIPKNFDVAAAFDKCVWFRNDNP